jgi:hypothetical protein
MTVILLDLPALFTKRTASGALHGIVGLIEHVADTCRGGRSTCC